MMHLDGLPPQIISVSKNICISLNLVLQLRTHRGVTCTSFDTTAYSDTPFNHFAPLPFHTLPFSPGDLGLSLLPRTV